ncbi:LacI family DNA-binding transcriptional regulator [Nocardia sp. NPDC051570]|uniref:LacI family DNA-binding transcriptional regulator n=1 Tax=Nocardia sp. NPDC051570 TaxID=3364324 RepID=UPI0037BC2DAA
MAYPKQRNGYYAGYFAVRPSEYEPVRDPDTGRIKRFKTESAAKKAADTAERNHARAVLQADLRPATGIQAGEKATALPTFAEYADRWYGRQDLARTTMTSYRKTLENHLIPFFGEDRLDEIDRDRVAEWAKFERDAGSEPSSIVTRRSTLNVLMGDAVDEYPQLGQNPVARKRNRGRRTSSRRRARATAAPTIGDLDGLLLAERAALRSHRDDEFVVETLRRWTGMRSGEVRGATVNDQTPGKIAINAQLSEGEEGKLFLEPPKDESYRHADLPPFLDRLLTDHIERTEPRPCPCHSQAFLFRGMPLRLSKNAETGVTVATVAQHVGVSVQTVRVAVRGRGKIAAATRQRVLEGAKELGFIPADPNECSPHWTGSGYYEQIYVPAATGCYLQRKGRSRSLVLTDDSIFPGIPVLGRNAASRATGHWEPITTVTRPHWNRHSHRTILEEMGTPKVLIDDRIGHMDSSVQGIYTHVTNAMRVELMRRLEARWWAAIDARLALSPRSPVSVLDEILQARGKAVGLPAAA